VAHAIEFGEGDGKKSSTALALYKAQLEALPKVVEFGELAGDKGVEGDSSVEFAAAPGYTVDVSKMETHRKAISYAEQNKCDYVTAVRAVEKT
jgi:hypothetical protein